MTQTVDLNADMGESFGPWVMGNDADLLEIITSANIACGFHAGDPDVMAKTMALAVKNGVGIGVKNLPERGASFALWIPTQLKESSP